MPTVIFTANLQRHVSCPDQQVTATSVREALEAVFVDNPRLRSYILDERGSVRPHVNVFVEGEILKDRRGQSDSVAPEAKIYVMQAISGG